MDFESDSLLNGGSTSSESMGDMLKQSPFDRLTEVLGEDGLSSIFSGLGSSSGGSSPFGESSPMSGDLPYGGNPFAGDNFWNIFAGGVNPSNI
jgi:hypothetical protein